MTSGDALLAGLAKGGSKPKPPKIPSPQFQLRHDRIQVDELPVAAEGVAQDNVLVQERGDAGHGNIRRGLIAPEVLEPMCRKFGVSGSMLNVAVPQIMLDRPRVLLL